MIEEEKAGGEYQVLTVSTSQRPDKPMPREIGTPRCLGVALDKGRRISTGALNPPRRGRPPKAKPGHSSGTVGLQMVESKGNSHSSLASVAIVPLTPRLLDLPASAGYLSVSVWTVRSLESAGILTRVRVPLPNQGELRKLLFDKVDLDRLIASWKDSQNG